MSCMPSANWIGTGVASTTVDDHALESAFDHRDERLALRRGGALVDEDRGARVRDFAADFVNAQILVAGNGRDDRRGRRA